MHKINILLVEDDEDYYIITRDLLSEIEGFKCSMDWVDTYDAAIKMIDNKKHDVYLFDYRLGLHTGLELLQIAIGKGCNAPIIILTGQDDREVDIQAMNAGAADYLIKGRIDPSMLERTIRYSIEQKKAATALQEAKEYSENLIESSLDLIISVDMQRRIIEFNRAAELSLGYKREEIQGKNIDILYGNPMDGMRIFNKTVQHTEFTGEVIQRNKNGNTFISYVSSSLLKNANGETVGVMSIVRDITERKFMEEQLIYDAFHDPLTGLPNRSLFIDRLKQAIEKEKRTAGYVFAVLFLDLDRFKIVNDSLGHLMGDQLLISIAQRFQSCLRTTDSIARFGGDEFAILLDDIREVQYAKLVADRIMEKLEVPFALNGHFVNTNTSIGIVISDKSHAKPGEVLRDADTVMYRAKALGRGHYVLFDSDMYTQAVNLLQLEADMSNALDRGELRVYYQPVISMSDYRIVGTEALVRWQHPKRGFILPQEFVPIAEETGLINQIGKWVLRQACNQNNIWQNNGFEHLTIAVNFSAHQFQYKNWLDELTLILNETGMSISYLDVEITESAIMPNMNENIKALKELRNTGIRVSIDDFGTGYSTLSSLKELPINTLKVDRSFIKDIATNSDAKAITGAIIAMANSLKLEVIAEGVENEEQLSYLKELKCNKIQGYIFSKPLPAEEITMLLQKGKGFWGINRLKAG